MVAHIRTAVVTGGSRGLGLALVRTLAGAGWRVVTDARDGDALRRATADLEVTAVAGDVTDPDHRAELVAAAGDRIDLLVNNAGGLGPSPLPALADYPLGDLTDLFAVNVVAQLGLIQAALPTLAPGAAIVDVTSDASVEAYEGWGGYGATKAALDQLGRVLAVERPDLRVLTVDPGDMRTQMHQDAFPGEDISDRPSPEQSVPGILALIESDRPSGRYRATEVVP
jgi:NAD(P)-dependent dehydrogenase (short-subunit alcohol dehydrogenase family)